MGTTAQDQRRVRAQGNSLAPRPLLAAAAVAAALVAAELVLRPFRPAPPEGGTTTIFMRDAELGWRLRPGADDVWGGVRLRINDKGLRGPELPYEKQAGVSRIVWLGDAVTFGEGLERYEDTFPHRVEVRLESELGARIETVNAGVGGYAPWQERAWLTSEGVRYAPDLVVVSFVLNDVVEPLDLARFGGAGEGRQLARTASRWRLEERSALFYYLEIAATRLRDDSAVREAAPHEALSARSLVDDPRNPAVRDAWHATSRELGALVSFCHERRIPVALVVWPCTFQLANPVAFSMPQRIMRNFAAGYDVPVIDLLPELVARLKADNLEAGAYFLDEDRPTALGSDVAAELIASSLVRAGLVTAQGRSASEAGG
jgi:hypothetical protein